MTDDEKIEKVDELIAAIEGDLLVQNPTLRRIYVIEDAKRLTEFMAQSAGAAQREAEPAGGAPGTPA